MSTICTNHAAVLVGVSAASAALIYSFADNAARNFMTKVAKGGFALSIGVLPLFVLGNCNGNMNSISFNCNSDKHSLSDVAMETASIALQIVPTMTATMTSIAGAFAMSF
jgi:hypothetical protein